MEAGREVKFVAYPVEGIHMSAGTVVRYIEPDREMGQRFGAYVVYDPTTKSEYECDERDVWCTRE